MTGFEKMREEMAADMEARAKRNRDKAEAERGNDYMYLHWLATQQENEAKAVRAYAGPEVSMGDLLQAAVKAAHP